MKKLFLLTLAGAIGGAVSAQTPAGTVKVTSPSHVTLQPIDRSHANYGVGNEPIFTGPPASSIRTDGQAPGSIVIGTTIYDLQTNSSVARRLLQHEGGGMTAVYTMAQNASYTDR